MSGGSLRSAETKRSNRRSKRSGIDLGDAEAEADRGVRRRAAALAEDAARLRVAHDVVDGEEVGRVAEPGDQLELVLDLGAHLVRHAARIAPCGALPGQLLEVLLHAQACGRRVDRVVVAQLVEGKAAGGDDLEAARERLRMAPEQAQDLGRRLQMALGVGCEAQARAIDRRVLADAGQHVLERPALGDVIEDVAGREQRRAAPCGELGQRRDPGRIVAAVAVLRGEIDRARELRMQAREKSRKRIVRLVRRQGDQDLAFGVGQHVREPELALALRGPPLAEGNELGEPAIGGAVGRKAEQRAGRQTALAIFGALFSVVLGFVFSVVPAWSFDFSVVLGLDPRTHATRRRTTPVMRNGPSGQARG